MRVDMWAAEHNAHVAAVEGLARERELRERNGMPERSVVPIFMRPGGWNGGTRWDRFVLGPLT